MTTSNTQDTISNLLRERDQALRCEGGSSSPEYRRISSKLAYYQNPQTRKRYLSTKDLEVERAKQRARYAANPKRRLEINKKWRDANREQVREIQSKYRSNSASANYHIANQLRSLVGVVGMNRKPYGGRGPRGCPKLEASVGCTREELQRHIEKLFRYGMTWENYGEMWEIDHCTPLGSFDLTDAAQLRKANHFSNLRPITRMERIANGNKRK